MKKSIFLVDDWDEEGPVTFFEKLYGKLRKKLEQEQEIRLAWLSEIKHNIYHSNNDLITFVKADEFIRNNPTVPDHVDVYYYINVWQCINYFHWTYFLAMDPLILDYLVENKIPVILEASMEMDENYHTVTRHIFETELITGWDTFTNTATEVETVAKNTKRYFRNVKDLKFYVIGGIHYEKDYKTDDQQFAPRVVDTNLGYFPGCLYGQNWENALTNSLRKNKDTIIDKIKQRQITEKTWIWQAYSSQPRFTRLLFQLRADYEKITDYGRYSRLIPGADFFKKNVSLLSAEWDKVRNYVHEDSINSLDEIKIIDATVADNKNYDLVDNSDFMFLVVLETSRINSMLDMSRTPTMITEKCMQPIIAGHPFITYGGHRIGEFLKSYGFKEYPGLEFPDNPNCIKELNQVIDKIRDIAGLTFEHRKEIYEQWKEIAIFNFNRYLELDIQAEFLRSIYNSKKIL